MRRLYLLLIGLAIVAFLAVSALLARVWNADGREHSAITSLVGAEAGGDGAAAVADVRQCRTSAACQARMQRLSAALRREGKLAILQLAPSTGFTVSSSTGVARVAWNTSRVPLPVVQCVRVHRAGDVLQGFHIELLRVSARIASNADCPASF